MTEDKTTKEDVRQQQPKKVRIHTMPEKFYIEEAGGGKKNTLLFILSGVFFLILLGAGAFFAIQKFGGDESNTNTPVVNENVNAAANDNKNDNANTTTNSVVNIDVNSSSNANTNTGPIANLFPDTNSSTNTVMNVNTISTGRDTDSDQLTDIEEAIYGTSITVADTDKDSYADGQEVRAGFDPRSNNKLESASTVRSYTNDLEGYTILYPAIWDIADDPITAGGKMFSADNGEFIEVSIESNPARLSAKDWYLTKSPGISVSQITAVTNWEGTLSGIIGADKQTVYYTRSDKVYLVHYNTTILSEASYQTTFEMMYKSFRPAAITRVPNTNINTNTNTNLNTNTSSGINVNILFNTNSTTNSNLNVNTNTNTNTNNTNTNINLNTGSSNRL